MRGRKSLARSGPAKLMGTDAYADLQSETNALLEAVLRPKQDAARRKAAAAAAKDGSKKKKKLRKSSKKKKKKHRAAAAASSSSSAAEKSATPADDDGPRATRDAPSDSESSARRRMRLPARSQFAASVEVLDFDDADADLDERPRSARSEDAGEASRARARDAVEGEAVLREFDFTAEASRVASGVDAFVPETGMSQGALDAARARVGGAVLSIETKTIEAQDTERKRKELRDTAESDAARARYARQLGGNAAATAIQAQFRGKTEQKQRAASPSALDAMLVDDASKESSTVGFVFDEDEDEDRSDDGGELSLPLPLFGIDRPINGGGDRLPAVSQPSPKHIQTQWIADDPRFVKQARAALRSGSLTQATALDDSFAASAARMFLPDGHTSQSALRATVRQALGRNRFDSVATLMAEPPPAEARAARRRAEARAASNADDGSEWMRASSTMGRGEGDGRPMAAKSLRSTMGGGGRGGRKSGGDRSPSPRSKLKAEKASGGGLAIRDVSHPSFQSTAAVGADTPAPGTAGQNLLGSTKMWEGKEICFACWSAGAGMTCRLHASASEAEAAMVQGDKSVLVCDNWDLDVMRKRYRSEELQEVFAKMNSSLRWNNHTKKFQTEMESKHPTYRAVNALTNELNQKYTTKMRLNAWVQSFIEDVRMSRSPKLKGSSGPKLLRLKKTIMNHALCVRFGKSMIETQPKPPTSASPDPIHRPDAEIPIPLVLYRSRPYRPATVVSMPLDSAAFLPTPPSKTMDERCVHTEKRGGVRWLEELSQRVASAAIERATSGGAQATRRVAEATEAEAERERLLAGDKRTHPIVVRADPVVAALAELAAQGSWFDEDLTEDEREASKPKAAPRPERLGIVRPILLETDNHAEFFTQRGVGPRNMASGGLPRAMTLTQLVKTAHPAQYGGLCAIQTDMVAPLKVMPTRCRTEANAETWLLPRNAEIDGWRAGRARYKTSFAVMELARLIPVMSCALVESELVKKMWDPPSVVLSASLLGTAATDPVDAANQRDEEESALKAQWASLTHLADQQRGGFLEHGLLGSLHDDTGYRVVVPCEGLVIKSEIPSSTFIPSEEIAVPNKPNFLPGVNTHADPDHYPFCVPTTLKNSLLDFYHLLGNDSGETSNDPCCFSSIGQQRSGNFGMGGDFGGAVGVLECQVYRSYAYAQTGEIEKMETDDGVEYWLNRRTGETYWEAPLSFEAKETEKLQDEEKRRKKLRKQAKALALANGTEEAAAPGAEILLKDKGEMRKEEVLRHVTTKHADALALSNMRERDDAVEKQAEARGDSLNEKALSQAASMASSMPQAELAQREQAIATPRIASSEHSASQHGTGQGTPRSSQLSARGRARLQPQVFRSDGSVRPTSRGGASGARPGSASSFRSMASARPMNMAPINRGGTNVPMLSLPASGEDVGDQYMLDTDRSDMLSAAGSPPSRVHHQGGSMSVPSRSAPVDQRQLLATMQQALSSAMPMIREQGGAGSVSSSQMQSMLELGMGLGLGIGMQQGQGQVGHQSGNASVVSMGSMHQIQQQQQQQQPHRSGRSSHMGGTSTVAPFAPTPRSGHPDQSVTEHRPSSADVRTVPLMRLVCFFSPLLSLNLLTPPYPLCLPRTNSRCAQDKTQRALLFRRQCPTTWRTTTPSKLRRSKTPVEVASRCSLSRRRCRSAALPSLLLQCTRRAQDRSKSTTCRKRPTSTPLAAWAL